MNSELTRNKGFTLIEVLVAAVILFASVTSALLSFQVAMQGTKKATDKLLLLARIEPIKSHIQKAILDAQQETPSAALSGSNNLLEVSFNWTAEVSRKAPPVPRFDPEASQFLRYQDRYMLYSVKVTVSYLSAQEQFEYLEFAYVPELKEVL
ncbi:type II secretion system protein [Rheinheimera sp. D18]|uniref:pilus assembly FimT family protein n=1 Tax=Rheinheimera sp. D18 TaxID=2545632 RepID=UPI0010435624|nr:type II secretion system protein [Rheinheimera sp. D18]QBL09788.1 type II secretion system protein [Rheinheimera sp. D18]